MIDQLRGALGDVGPAGWIGIVATVVVLILLPAIIAQLRRHPDRRLIFVGSVLLGWTTTGWVALMAWAVTGVQSRRIREWIERRYGK